MEVTTTSPPRRRRAIRWLGTTAAVIAAAVAMAPPTAASVATVNTWTQVAPTPEGRFGPSATTGTDGTIYAIGGLCPNLFGFCFPVGTNEAYSPTHNTWTVRAPMPTPRQCLAASAGTDGRIYALGGEDQSGTTLNTAEVYTPATNTWTELPPMQKSRGCLGAATDSAGRIYAVGGLENDQANGFASTPQATVERYSPSTNTWAFIPTPMPVALSAMGVTTGPDGRIYVVTGVTASDGPSFAVYAYAPDTDTWTSLAPMTDGNYNFVNVTTGPDGRIYAIGGTDLFFDFNNPNAVEAYTPATDSWASAPSTIDPRMGAAAASSHGRVFVLGGADQSFNVLSSVEAYTPAKISTTTLTSSSNPSTSGSAVTLTATVFPNSVTGTVTFMDSGNAIGTVSVGKGGIATLTTSSLSSGSHTLTAVYSGDATYGGSSSTAVTQVVQ